MFEHVFHLIASNYTLQIVTLGALILGITAGALGAFAVLREQSLLGDAISHATLPGVGLAFLITQDKSPLTLLIGAGIAGWLGTICVKLITQSTRVTKDAALGIILSVFFGFGLVIITIVQKLPTATKAGLDKFLFGNAATLLKEDVVTMTYLSSIVLLLLILFWKEFKLLTFDNDFFKSLGLPFHIFDILLTTLIVSAIILGLQTVGVVLMSAMIVAPAAAARQWTDRLGVMVILSSFLGALCCVAGAITSSIIPNMPTGPIITVYLSLTVIISLFLAPHRGLVWDWIRIFHQRAMIESASILQNLLILSESHTDPFHPHEAAVLKTLGTDTLRRNITKLVRAGLIKQYPGNLISLTPLGLKKAKVLTHNLHTESQRLI